MLMFLNSGEPKILLAGGRWNIVSELIFILVCYWSGNIRGSSCAPVRIMAGTASPGSWFNCSPYWTGFLTISADVLRVFGDVGGRLG